VRARFARSPLRLPFAEAAIENGGIVETAGAQHPPEARGPHWALRRIDDDARFWTDACLAACRGEILDRRHGETERRFVIGKVVREIEKGCTRYMGLFIVGATALDPVRAGRRGQQMHRRIENPQIRIAEMRLKPGRRYKAFSIPFSHHVLPLLCSRFLSNSLRLHNRAEQSIGGWRPKRTRPAGSSNET
jgi:hypothetical protein